MGEEREIPVRVTSMYGARTQQPIVTLVVGDTMHQFTPDKAREIAGMLVECAEAAEQDGFLVEWGADAMGLSPEQAARLVTEFREYRRKWREGR